MPSGRLADRRVPAATQRGRSLTQNVTYRDDFLAQGSANLHRITVQQAADIMNVSRRSVFMVMELEATGRADLLADVAAGRLTLLKALKMAKPEKYKVAQPKRLERLKGLWSLASNEERLEFLDWIIGRIESRSES